MNIIIQALRAPGRRLVGSGPGRAAVPRWTLAELGVMSLAGILLLAGVLLLASGTLRAPAPAMPYGATVPEAGDVQGVKSVSPNSVAAGQPLDFSITFTNVATASATVLNMSDPLPANAVLLTGVSIDVTNLGGMNCGLESGIVQCRDGILGGGASGTVTIHVTSRGDAAGTYQNTAAWTWFQGVQRSAAANFTIIGPSPTPTTVPPTFTPVPPTATPPAATATPIVGVPTDTPGVPTNTPTVGVPVNTPTSGVPTNTPTVGVPVDTATPGTGGTATITPRSSPTSLPATPTSEATPTPLPSSTPGGPVPTNTSVPPAATNTPVPANTAVPPATNTPGGPPPTNTPVRPPNTPGLSATPRPPTAQPPPPNATTRPSDPTNTPGGSGCGLISGTLSKGGSPVAGATVELRSKANSGADLLLASAQTNAGGTYSFSGIAAAPADARYYVRYGGGAGGTVAFWYGTGFTYAACATTQVADIDVGDVAFSGLCMGGQVTLPGTLTWTKRNATDQYRLTIYAGSNPVLDSGDLGNADNYTVGSGALPNGQYSAILTIRNGSGNGQASGFCVFGVGQPVVTVGTVATAIVTAVLPPPPPPGFGTPTLTAVLPPRPPSVTAGTIATAVVSVTIPTATAVPGASLSLNKSVDQAAANPGETLDYTLVVVNLGAGPATNVTLVDTLADGLLLDPNNTTAGGGQLKLNDNTVLIVFGTINPGERRTANIRASVIGAVNSVQANSATLAYDQNPAGLRSNTVETLIVGVGTPKPTAKPGKTVTAGIAGQGTAVPVAPRPTKTAKPGTTVNGQTAGQTPTTGGEFPLVSGLSLLLLALLLRQVRLRRQAAQG